jgi:hypothetical protein
MIGLGFAATAHDRLGTFSLDAMARVSMALSKSDGASVLVLVVQLPSNGGSPQHFSGEPARCVRDLLMAKISGTPSRLVTASPAEHAQKAQIAAAPAAVPVASGPPSALDDWRSKLRTAMTEMGRTFSPDAIAQAEVALVSRRTPDRPFAENARCLFPRLNIEARQHAVV